MADPWNYDADPIRPGADPRLDVNAAGLRNRQTLNPASIRMTGALVGWLRYHFGLASRIEFPNLAGRVYTSDPGTTQIWIGSLAEWKPELSGKRPALLVDRLAQDFDMQHRVLADQFQGIKPGFYCDFMQGTHVVHCVGGREGETDFLAYEVWREFGRYRNIARDALCLHRFLPLQIGKRVQLADEHKEHYTVPVIVAYAYEQTWRVRPLDEVEITQVRTVLGDG